MEGGISGQLEIKVVCNQPNDSNNSSHLRKQLLDHHKQQQYQNWYNVIEDNALDINNLESINSLSEPLTQGILQRGQLNPGHCDKHRDIENDTSSRNPNRVSGSYCIEYLNDD
ncbi:unnamed protein product [Ceratitis capitata]|uniref:(Mediterranean fruit fly) hypothetical protein n=1 Tax=Ceratitis capitata TaxID=7213 RepID=A0A811UQC3_CERCA|nr:unnamed protein product [Ceratitis capitata]